MTKSLPPKSLVLYADDDADDRDLVREAFEQFSSVIEILTFEEGRPLINYLMALHPLQPRPCLIILDVNMHGLGGKETLRQLRDLPAFADIPVVLFTTSTLPSEMAFARAFNAGFVTKPLYNAQISQLVDQLIGRCADHIKDRIRNHRN